MAAGNLVSEHIRANRERITEAWRRRVAPLPGLSNVPPAAVADHMPEFLGELAGWIAGEEDAAARAYERLVQGHALQRLGIGVDLETLLREYAILREVVLTEVLAVVSTEKDRETLVQLNQALDLAMHESVQRFALRRDEVRDLFVSILGHDLRNPLQSLMFAADNLLAKPDCGEPSHARYATAIRRSGDTMARMIGDVLDFALGHLGGGIPAIPKTCDMGQICREVIEDLRTTNRGRAITLTTGGDLVGSWDRDRVSQALGNLISNALVHGVDPIVVRVTEEPDHQGVITSVRNAGPPIPPETIGSLFDPFKRGTKARRGGLGLGLYIVNQIALAHGATCEVRSTAAEGTTFSIRWPRTPLTEVKRPYQDEA